MATYIAQNFTQKNTQTLVAVLLGNASDVANIWFCRPTECGRQLGDNISQSTACNLQNHHAIEKTQQNQVTATIARTIDLSTLISLSILCGQHRLSLDFFKNCFFIIEIMQLTTRQNWAKIDIA